MAFESYYKLVKYKNLNKIPFYLENVSGQSTTVNMDTSYSDATNVEYSTDGITWSSTAPAVPANGRVYIRANATRWWNTGAYRGMIYLSNQFNVGGNIMSLLYGSNFTGNETTFPSGSTYTFKGLFRGIGYLRSAEHLLLPATTHVIACYSGLFEDCNHLTTAPVLPATTVVNNSYSDMFHNCTALTVAPELPATTLDNYCYYEMFSGCTSLVAAPALPATTLADSCYQLMFYGCSSLNTITCLATNISASGCTGAWLNGVAASGTFTKAASMSSWTTGANGIPSGWTVQDAQ